MWWWRPLHVRVLELCGGCVKMWSKAPPTASEVQERHRREGQMPHYWWRPGKDDYRSQEVIVLQLDAPDGKVWIVNPQIGYHDLSHHDGGTWAPCELPPEDEV